MLNDAINKLKQSMRRKSAYDKIKATGRIKTMLGIQINDLGNPQTNTKVRI